MKCTLCKHECGLRHTAGESVLNFVDTFIVYIWKTPDVMPHV